MDQTDKHAFFQKNAAKRLDRIIAALNSLGNCSKPTIYAYEDAELALIFHAITDKLEEVWQRMFLRSPYSCVPFRLRAADTLTLCGHTLQASELASKDKVLALLEDGAPNFTSLEPIRNQYKNQCGDELCWCCPIPHSGHSGCVLIPVKEGILYFAYDAVDNENCEQFDLQSVGTLLTQAKLEELRAALRQSTAEMFQLLSGISAYGLAQRAEDHNTENDTKG